MAWEGEAPAELERAVSDRPRLRGSVALPIHVLSFSISSLGLHKIADRAGGIILVGNFGEPGDRREGLAENNFGICPFAPHPNSLPGVPGRGSYFVSDATS